MKASVFLDKINTANQAIVNKKVAYLALEPDRPRWRKYFLRDDGTVDITAEPIAVADVAEFNAWLLTLLL